VRVNRINVLLAVVLMLISATAFAAPEGKKIATVQIPVNQEMYAATPTPLNPAQCAQCHEKVFGNLKTDGGKHRFECQKCHTTFHSYNPKKNNWDEIMPKCDSCHAQPHGKAIVDCANCHSNPHAPKKVGMTTRLTNACGDCHSGAKDQLVKFPSKHSKLACQKCHTSHGYKPACSNCHKPHYQGQDFGTCVKCHPVHKPREILYEKTTPAVTCGACHVKVFDTWKKTPSLHGKVNCANCHHTKHKYIPKCQECHGSPHKKEILDKFPRCLDCHLDVHDLPVQKKK